MSSQLQVSGEAKIRDIQGPVVANSGVITALDGAASQYVRGDGTLADFPTSTGGGSSVSYYLNSSVSQGTIGGVAYRELSKEPIIGAGTDITISANGYVASYITDANDPDVLSVPGGNFNCEFYFSVNNNTGNPTTYAELYKYDGTTFTLLGSSVAVPESLNQGTTIAPYYFAIPVATAALALTDRLAIRIYVSVDGRVVTLHTENSHLCQVVTTFSKGMVSLNNLTDQSQFITTGTSGTDFNIVSSGDTHTFNIPSASNNNRGLITNLAQTIGGIKTFSSNINADSGIRLKNGVAPSANGYVGIGSNTQGLTLGVYDSGSAYYHELYFPYTNGYEYTFPATSGTLALTSNIPANIVTGTGTTNTLSKFTGTSTIGNSNITDTGSLITLSSNVTTTGSQFVQNGFYLTNANAGATAGYTHMWGADDGIFFGLRNATGGAKFVFQSATSYNYTFPAATGTLALTSNLSAYLPLTGGTLSGALSGTSATFRTDQNAYTWSRIDNQANNAAAYAGLQLGAYGNTWGIAIGSSLANSNSLNFVIDAGGTNTPRLTIASTGAATFSSSVTATSYIGEASTTELRLRGGGYGGSYNTSLRSGTGAIGVLQLGNNGDNYILAGNTAVGGYLIFRVNCSSESITSGIEAMRITTGGNVGIGTSSPSNLLHISGAGTGAMLRIQNTSTVGGDQGPMIQFVSANQVGGQGFESGYIQSIWTGEGNAFSMRFATKVADGSQTESMRITTDGAVLVGASSTPSSSTSGVALQNPRLLGPTLFSSGNVSDSRSFVQFINANGVVGQITTSGTSTSYVTSSDYRLKQDLKDYNGLDLVSAIKTYDYEWKSDNTRSYGVIAHELQEVIPQAVYGEKDGEQMQGVDYSKIVPILIKSIQELQAKIVTLESKIN